MSDSPTVRVGIIGSGKRGIRCLATRMAELSGETPLRVVAVHDSHATRAGEARQYVQRQFSQHQHPIEVRVHEDIDSLIEDVDLVMVTTPQFAHRPCLEPALRSGKRAYVDKPIAHNLEDAVAIVRTAREHDNLPIMGFTRRYEAPWRKAYELVEEGAIGSLQMMQIRAVIPYNVYFHTWHRRREWSGDALNDKSSHHMDVFNWFAGGRAEKVTAFGGRAVYLPEDDAPARCSECDRECPYRRGPLRASQDEMSAYGRSWDVAAEVRDRIDNCVYLPGADIYDHAIVQIAYHNGILASLFYCIFGPAAEDQETFELVGSSGRIRLTRHTGELDVVSEYGKRHEVVDCRTDEFSSSHFGADLQLVRDVAAFCNGVAPVCTVYDGLEATRMVVAALQSLDSGGELVRMAELPDA